MRNPIVGIVAMTSVLSCQGIPTEDSESQSNDQPGGSSVYPGCALFDVPVSSATQWRYAVQWKGERHGLEIIRVERVDGTQIELSTTVQLPEENLHWSTTIDCESHRIVAQGRPELAFAVWPFPGVLEGQVVDRPVTDDRRFTIPARHLRGPPRSIALTYRTYTGGSAGRTRVVRVSEQGRITEFDVAPRIGPVEVRFPDGSALELIGAAHAAALEAILAGEDNEGLANNPGLWPIGDPARMSSLTKGRIGTRALTTDDTATPGTRDYSSMCSLLDATTYDGHWPEQTFVTKVGTVRDGTVLAGDDLTALHDDRDSEFTFWPDDAQFAHDYEVGPQEPGAPPGGQKFINVELESLVWFPKHPEPNPNYPDQTNPPTVYGANHFANYRDISYQSPVANDRVAMRGSAVVDCGHVPLLEIHPPQLLYWRHQLVSASGSPIPGLAFFFVRASAYGWHPHIETFRGPFEADLDVPDAANQTPLVGGIAVDYAISGYDVCDDSGFGNLDHPVGNLMGGDFSRPYSDYFNIAVTPNGSNVHLYATPTDAFAPVPGPTAPPRPALIGFHFIACVPVTDSSGRSLNGCLGPDSIAANAPEYVGQAVPVRLGETLNGYFYDRHKPNDPLTFDVRAFADTCDQHTEVFIGTVTTYPPNHTFSIAIPNITRICTPTSPGTPANEPVDGIFLKHFAASNSDVPEPDSTKLFEFFVPPVGRCVDTPESVVSNGVCPAGSGFTGAGYFQCGTGTLVPYCQPGLSGQPGVPGTPTGVTATGGANQITVSWQPVPMTVAYNVYLAGTSTRLAGTLDTSVTFTGLGNGVTQSYQVVGVNPNPAGEGPRSAVVTATTVHCSQNCPTGCCNGETCSSVPTWGNGCKNNGQACGPACPAGTDICLGATCVCHDYGRICDPVIGQADYPRNCGTFNNACGTTTNCGTCPANYVCTAGPGPGSNCVCSPMTASQACGGACGTTAPNGCGGSVTCPACPPPGGGGGCFAAGTGVTMADGSVKPIEDVAAGDEVLSYDVETAAVVPGVVTRTFAHPATPALLRINGTLATTPEHRFLVNGRWIAAGKLRVGDGLLRQECAAGSCQSGDAARVESVEVLRGEATTDAAALMSPKILSSELATDVAGVASLQTLSGQETSYNLEVAPYQTYFVEGVVVSTLKQ